MGIKPVLSCTIKNKKMNNTKKIIHIIENNIDCSTACNLVEDEYNPHFIFSLTATELLALIAQGKIDAVKYAKQQLAGRGYNSEGHYVGFKNAKTLLES